ncbi:MAG: HAD hydrolase-like protein [Candidatus Micrarchaeota archaeon]|nr:HAD hydrolase-like protein [Candidatus Micrarchaeota archaeon]
MKETYVFDVDGTLVNSLPHIYKSYCLACKKFKIKEPLLETLRKTYDQSNNFRNTAIAIGVPLQIVDEFNYTVYEFFKREIKRNKPELIPTVYETLLALKSYNIDMKLLSLDYLENTVYKLGENIVKNFFSEIINPYEGKAASLLSLKSKIKGKIVYIGDCVSDGEAALTANVEFIGIATKFSYSHEEKMIEFINTNRCKTKYITNYCHLFSKLVK